MISALLGLSIFLLITLIILVLRQGSKQNSTEIQSKLDELNNKIKTLESIQERTERGLHDEFGRNREEMGNNLKRSGDSLSTHMRDLSKMQADQLGTFADRLKEMSQTTEASIKRLQEENSKKLEEMRITVDEKLQVTLEKRISTSFQQVSERLEQVYKGLGEMQNLAAGVGDLKKVLSNVKTRGTWGEMQLSNLLEQILSPDQYEANVQTKPKTQERVDFAIKLPGKDDNDQPVWLPIDAKFPQEDYQRLVEAQESGNLELADQAIKQLEARIKLEAKSIRDKYIEPPFTTDFALLFLPTEGLYAEVIRRPGLLDKLQLESRVNVVGPTTLAAMLNALQMGFRTLTIQKRSSEVWKMLIDIRKHFGSFGDLLSKAYKKVQEASEVIEDAGKRSRTIESRLNKIGEIPDTSIPEQVSLN